MRRGSSLIRKGFSRTHTIYHTSRGNTPALIHTRFRRFLCKDCGITFTYRPDWIHPWLPITSGLFTDILKDFSSTKSMREIAADHCVSESIVRGIFDAVSVKPSLTLSRTVCIDEFKGDAGVYDPESGRWRRMRFQCNVVNGEDRYVALREIVENLRDSSVFEPSGNHGIFRLLLKSVPPLLHRYHIYLFIFHRYRLSAVILCGHCGLITPHHLLPSSS